MHPITIRRADPQDAPEISRVHVACWRETYTGLLPDPVLADLNVNARCAMWTRLLTEAGSAAETLIFVAEQEAGVIGFGACGPPRSDAFKAQGFDAEIGALYVLVAAQRQGIGHSIMTALATELLDTGRRSAGLWVLRNNGAARRFYGRHGGEIEGEKTEAWSGTDDTEIAYGWRDLSVIVRRPASA